MTSFANKVFVDDHVKIRSLGLSPIQYDFPFKKGNLDTNTDMHVGRMPSDNKSRNPLLL